MTELIGSKANLANSRFYKANQSKFEHMDIEHPYLRAIEAHG